MAQPDLILDGGTPNHRLLVRRAGNNKGAALEVVIRGGKYRVESAYDLDPGQLERKIEKANARGGRVIHRSGAKSPEGEIASPGSRPVSRSGFPDSPSSDSNITPSDEEGKTRFSVNGDKGNGFSDLFGKETDDERSTREEEAATARWLIAVNEELNRVHEKHRQRLGDERPIGRYSQRVNEILTPLARENISLGAAEAELYRSLPLDEIFKQIENSQLVEYGGRTTRLKDNIYDIFEESYIDGKELATSSGGRNPRLAPEIQPILPHQRIPVLLDRFLSDPFKWLRNLSNEIRLYNENAASDFDEFIERYGDTNPDIRFSLKDLRQTYADVKSIVGDVVKPAKGHEKDMSWFDASPFGLPEWNGHKGFQAIVKANLRRVERRHEIHYEITTDENGVSIGDKLGKYAKDKKTRKQYIILSDVVDWADTRKWESDFNSFSPAPSRNLIKSSNSYQTVFQL